MIRRLSTVLLLSILVCLLLAGTASAVVKDINADGSDDILSLYNYGNSTTGALSFNPASGSLVLDRPWLSGAGSWDAANSMTVEGDFYGDGLADLAVLYNYGNSNAGLWIFEMTNSGLIPHKMWQSGNGCWNAAQSKMVAGNFCGDGHDDLAIMYNYGTATTGLFVFESNGSSLALRKFWQSGAACWEAGNSKFAAGNISGDAYEDLVVLHDYGNSTTGIWVFEASANSFIPRPVWQSAPGCWSTANSKLTVGNFSGDDRADMAIMYDYGNATGGIWVMETTNSTYVPTRFWLSAPRCWDVSKSKIVAGNYRGTANDDLGVFYDYGNATTGLWIFETSGTGFNLAKPWQSKAGCWDWTRTKVAGSATFLPRTGISYARGIDINLSAQLLVCVNNVLTETDEGIFSWIPQPIFSTLVSSGKPGYDTPTGTYSVYAKDVVTDMAGLAGSDQEYYVPNVPYVLWFYRGYSIHGAYWHNDFGNVRSHGCVNVPVDSGAWIYSWAPVGTPVIVHY